MRVGPGSPFPGPFKRADTANNILEAAEEYRLRRKLGTATATKSAPLQPDLVKVKNGTSTLLRAGEVVELNDDVLTNVVRGYQWFNAAVPNETRPFAILLEGIANDSNAIGLAQISGVCPALVNVQATTDLWAFVENTADTLKGDRFWGDVRILNTPGGTGEQLVWVQITPSPYIWIGKADANIAAGGTGTVSVYAGTPGSETDTTHNIASVRNRSGLQIDSGKWCEVKRINRKPYADPLECPA